ncbi:hypothetical protein [Paenibacillus pini]|uniref:Sporulation membrane protein YtrI C-terminal domain-containing protein n=1 Tax=Paenibacillus pini JCM 16418 TaxID=1236976 RepID=W7YNS1_9BACL|nr:hypothetical protein [Paenibacillus pini]GAF06316.1 hypothetical protein JCM16418_267 [Paenibacillus pini JCM 16418]
MRLPPFQRYRRFMQMSAVFVLGIIVGSVLYNSIFHSTYNLLWMSNQELELQIQQYQKDIKTLKKYNTQQTVIKEIKIRSEQQDPPIDTVVVKALLQQLGSDLEVLRGQNVYDIDKDSKITRSLLNQKTYKVRDKDYAIQIKTMLVMDGMLQIWVNIVVPKVH